jgi:hypothetical protein
MRYEDLKEEIKAIAVIADSVPEVFKERCFEVLLQNLIASGQNVERPAQTPPQKPPTVADAQDAPPSAGNGGSVPTPSQIKVFMQKTGVTAADLAKVVIYDDNSAHFIQEPIGNKIARGQVEWALLLALKKGIEKNVLDVDPEDVRSICQDKGFYDATNFSTNFKGAVTAKLFQGEMKKQGAAQKLSNEGLAELGKIIKEFAARPTQ